MKRTIKWLADADIPHRGIRCRTWVEDGELDRHFELLDGAGRVVVCLVLSGYECKTDGRVGLPFLQIEIDGRRVLDVSFYDSGEWLYEHGNDLSLSLPGLECSAVIRGYGAQEHESQLDYWHEVSSAKLVIREHTVPVEGERRVEVELREPLLERLSIERPTKRST